MGGPDNGKKTKEEETTASIVEIIHQAANDQKEALNYMTKEIAKLFKEAHKVYGKKKKNSPVMG